MYCTVFFSLSLLLINLRVLFEEECWSSTVFYGLFYYICSLCSLLCFHHFSTSVYCPHCHTAYILNDMTEQHSKFSQLTSELKLSVFPLRAWFSILTNTKPWSMRGTNRDTSVVVVKLLRALWLQLSCVCPARDQCMWSCLLFTFH